MAAGSLVVREAAPSPADRNPIADRLRGAAAVVLLPTLNEEEGLAHTLEQLPFARFADPRRRVEVLVIDGGSTDRTAEVAKARGVLLIEQSGTGKGDAVLEAILWVHSLGVPNVVVLDADATYPPDRILPTLDLLESGADLVIGVRRPVWGPAKDGRDMVHRLGNLIFSYSASFLTRRTILDLCSGFWGVSTSRFAALEIRAARFAIEAEMVLKSVRRGYNVVQIPVDYRERIGVAKLHAVRDGARIMLAIIRFGRPGRLGAQVPSGPDPISRQLQSIGVISETPAAVVRYSPSSSVRATEIAGMLRSRLPETPVRMSAEADPITSSSLTADPEARPDLIVSLTGASSTANRPSGVTVALESRERQLRIALARDDLLSVASESGADALARSGALRLLPDPNRARGSRHPGLEVLIAQVRSDSIGRQSTLLRANGFRVAEERTEAPRPPAAIAVEAS